MNLSLTGMSLALLTLSCCRTSPGPQIQTVEYVDLDRFMGDWYVVANIPTFLEKGAHNAVESYERSDDGTIATTFTFRAGRFDGPVRRFRPKGFVLDTRTNAVWGMRFVWPIKADYRILYLNDDYTQTVIGRQKRDYVWIMARTPSIPEPDFERILRLLSDLGYDVSRIERVPQRWQ